MPRESTEQPSAFIPSILIELMKRSEMEDNETPPEQSPRTTEEFHMQARFKRRIAHEGEHYDADNLYRKTMDFIIRCWQNNPENPQIDLEALKTRFPEFIRPLVEEIFKGSTFPIRPSKERLN